MWRMRRVFALCVALFLGVSCDTFWMQPFVVRNQTDVTVVVYPDNRALTPTAWAELGPGDTKLLSWESPGRYPPEVVRERTVHAYDRGGNLVFCSTYRFDFVNRERPVITVDVVKGVFACDQSTPGPLAGRTPAPTQ